MNQVVLGLLFRIIIGRRFQGGRLSLIYLQETYFTKVCIMDDWDVFYVDFWVPVIL